MGSVRIYGTGTGESFQLRYCVVYFSIVKKRTKKMAKNRYHYNGKGDLKGYSSDTSPLGGIIGVGFVLLRQ